MFQNNHTDQLDFSKLMFYKFFFALISIGNFPMFNSWDTYATLNCEASGRKCCNITKDTSRPKMKRSRCNFGPNQTNKVNSTEKNNTQTIANNQEGGNAGKWIRLNQHIDRVNKLFKNMNLNTIQYIKPPSDNVEDTSSLNTYLEQLNNIEYQLNNITEKNISTKQSLAITALRQYIQTIRYQLQQNESDKHNKYSDEHIAKLHKLKEGNNISPEQEKHLEKLKSDKDILNHKQLNKHTNDLYKAPSTPKAPTSPKAPTLEQHATDAKAAVEKATTKAKEKAKAAHTFMKSSTSNKRQSKMYSKRSGKISGAAFQEAQAVAENLPYLEEAIDSPATPSANSMTFDAYPYKPTNRMPPNYIQSLEQRLMRHDPLFLETVNEIYDTMDTTTMTFLNKLFTNAIPYINRVKLYVLLAEMFPALAIEMEALVDEMKLDPSRAEKYNKKIDENLRHLLYKYRTQVIKNRTEGEIAWNRQKEKIKNTIKQSSGLNKQTT